jgi:hypothetical protein
MDYLFITQFKAIKITTYNIDDVFNCLLLETFLAVPCNKFYFQVQYYIGLANNPNITIGDIEMLVIL